ncbi:hypothetical protein EOD39_0452 [Acipenser ruthenus]|uniref:Genetic suppressor element 1 n=1 Tax=Acipenser ruthenus TaxID=7906 RepID=A0A444U2Y3_ACIRT|nr:hypothetical protein EOD39_0452 [Acipenser ruthenus]
MNDPRVDKDFTPISRKHRLMAAVLAGEESALPGNSSRSDRNGIGIVYCFICGGGVTPGKELKLQVNYQIENFPFFPFLQHQEPAPGAEEVTPDGCVTVCAVCQSFLGEQWNSFERTRTPIEKRMYWLKRPYQCDSRRIPQEWNTSYDLERRMSVSSQNFDARESDFSSLSDNENMSDQELDFVDRPVMHKEKCTIMPSSNKTSKEGVTKYNDIKSCHDSQMGTRYLVGGYAAQDAQKSDSALQPGRSVQSMNHAAQAYVSLAHFQECLPQRSYDTPSSETPVQDNGIIIRNKQRLPEENAKHPDSRQHTFDSSCSTRDPLVMLQSHKVAAASLSPVGALNVSDRGGYSDSDNEINITSDNEQEKVFDITSSREHVIALNRQIRETGSVIAKSLSNSNAVECACYICGSKLSQNNQHKVYVQKQERISSQPFFPFLWLHSPPPGALPLSPGGCTLVCDCCHSSLMQQWQGFELANVPVLQRLYVVPLNAGTSGLAPRDSENHKLEKAAAREACYLCGEDCCRDLKVTYSKVFNSNPSTMHFPFINLLPCPPNAKAVKNGKVHCCQTCFSILEDIWVTYKACLSEELITSVNSFLSRYHQAVPGAATQSSSLSHQSSRMGHISVCYLCGVELPAGREFQLSVNPPGRCGEREPFFPFLTVHPPAPMSKPADSTGLVSTCVLCYHDLLGQWVQHEGRGSQPTSSPWSRQYGVDTFVCFFCRQQKKRCLGLKTVQVARLPVFLYAPRVSNALVVDDGKKLTIGSCVDCKAVVLAGQNMKQNCLVDSVSPPGRHKLGN